MTTNLTVIKQYVLRATVNHGGLFAILQAFVHTVTSQIVGLMNMLTKHTQTLNLAG